MSEFDDNLENTPPELAAVANNLIENLLPTKSRDKYEKSYKKFENWCTINKAQHFTENVLLAYFSELVTKSKMKSSTLWSEYSMLKAVINLRKAVDVSKFLKLRAYLKKQGEGYSPKKSRVLTKNQVDLFLRDAPDNKYLATKVISIWFMNLF